MDMETKALDLGSHQVGGSLSVCHVDSVVPGHEAPCAAEAGFQEYTNS
ncbi:hypothetical protein L914_10613 [Phytophthora nicotianae]|uniref:Uncharacterized protein n=1 Tax=Phytophthora nicotianae TaxID=4792 RepID=W2N6B6_PHYNI|nr:hypothetical protein L914_10613 [Phytophthora nicotianae]